MQCFQLEEQRALPAEYAAKARQVDERYCGTPSGQIGSVAQRLETFEPVRGLVFGAWGEASPCVHQLLAIMARTGAQHHWRAMRCDDPLTAVGIVAWLLKRRWGLTALREQARLKLARLEYVGRGAVAAAGRRMHARDMLVSGLRAAAGFDSGPRGRLRGR